MNSPAKKYSTLLTALILVIASYGQKNYLPGYIVTAANDTMKGYIDYRNWKKKTLTK